ncbi:uncharacterized protein [Mobula birostris]|uniref:uncharacterized protein n=1 Tax=Mobula birostris TaxID=1983395 RepID=UPI003B28635C
MFNPHVPVVDVLTFLARYVESVGTPADVKDGLGIWTSKRQVKVKLRLDSNGGIIHPPSVFAIGGNRGYMVYAGQPRVCRNCGKEGHIAAQCRVVMCRNCKIEGHLTKDCTQAKACNLCGQAGHLYRACPRRGGTYAQATRGGAGPERAQADADVPASAADEAPDRTDDETREEGASTPRPATPLQTLQDQANDEQESMEEGRAEGETEWKVVKRKKTQKAAAKRQKAEQRQKRAGNHTAPGTLSSSEEEGVGGGQQPRRKKRLAEQVERRRERGESLLATPQVQEAESSRRTELRESGSRATAGTQQPEGEAAQEVSNPPGPDPEPERPHTEEYYQQYLSPQEVEDFTKAVGMKAQDGKGEDGEQPK